MDYSETSRLPEAAETDPSAYQLHSADAPAWQVFHDAARGERRLLRNAFGRAAEWVGADRTHLSFTHDADGNLRQISRGDWFLNFEGQTGYQTFAVADAQDRTEVLLDKGGQRRSVSRGGETLTLELDGFERVTRVSLPGSACALLYEWHEDGGCIVRGEGGLPLLTLSAVGDARRYALADDTWWDERLSPLRAGMEAVVGGLIVEELDIAMTGLAMTATRRWRDGSGDCFERDDRGRLSTWTRTGADGIVRAHILDYDGADLVEGWNGKRVCDSGGRVQTLIRTDGSRVHYRYDPAGRRIERRSGSGTTRYAYDPLGNLIRLIRSDGTEQRFAHDGIGRRIAVLRQGRIERREHRDECGRLWAVSDADGKVLHSYIWVGDRMAARIDGPVGAAIAEAWPCDPCGTPIGVFRAEGDSWRFERLSTPPFGSADDPARPGLYGHIGDRESGLIHFGARELDPELGLFLTPDPWHGDGDDPRRLSGVSMPAEPLERELPAAGSHAYALCQFDPVGRSDRDGHLSAGEVVLHIVRWMLLPTWGFPMTSISLFFFEPINLYMEIVGLILFGFKQFCEEKSHPWGNHTIVKSTFLLGSKRQFTFALGLNGFLPRVVSGISSGFNRSDRAVTVGNVIWINSVYLSLLERSEVIEIDKIAGDGGALKKFNDDSGKISILALLAADKAGKQKLAFSAWARGYGNTVVMRAQAGGGAPIETFGDDGAPGAIHLLRAIPHGIDVPHKASDKERLEVIEFTRGAADRASTLKTAGQTWFSLRLAKDTGFAKGQWLQISAPKAPDPKPDPAFLRIRDFLPASDQLTAILSAELPLRFQNAGLSHDLRLDQVDATSASTPVPGWNVTAPATKTLALALAPGTAVPAFAANGLLRCVATTGAQAAVFLGTPPPIAVPEDTSFGLIKECRVELELAPDGGPAAVASDLHRRRGQGPRLAGMVEKTAQRDKIKLATPHPAIKKDELLIVSRAGFDDVHVRVVADAAAHKITIDPELPIAFAPADNTGIQLQRTQDTETDKDKATVTALNGAAITVRTASSALLAPGNLVRIGNDGSAVLRHVKAVSRIEIDLADEPVGTGPFALTVAGPLANRMKKGVELSQPGRILKYVPGLGSSAPSTLGFWPDHLLAISTTSVLFDPKIPTFYARWPVAGRPATLHKECQRGWEVVKSGTDEFVVLEEPLPLVRQLSGGQAWRLDPDNESEGVDIKLAPGVIALSAFELTASGAKRSNCLAHEPEALVPDDPATHDTHRRCLIEHEMHHTVQCNLWGPLMTALPLQGLVMTVADIIEGLSGDVSWLNEVERDANGNTPTHATGHLPHNTELNALEILSIGGLMQVAWKYIFLAPFRLAGSSQFSDKIEALDFKDFEKLFNPASRLITQRLPQVDSQAAPGERWLQALAQLFANALDLRSWTPGIGLVPTLLPDGPANFIEQGASRASGELYSSILSANDRFNRTRQWRFVFKGKTTNEADLKIGIGKAVRMLHFYQYTADRSFGTSADNTGNNLTYRSGSTQTAPVTITVPSGTALLPSALYDSSGAARFLVDAPASMGAGVTHEFFEAGSGIDIFPKLRALVPMPPNVNRTYGFYLITAGEGKLHLVAQTDDPSGGTEIVDLTIIDEVKLGSELVPWAKPPVSPTRPTAPPLVRLFGEVAELAIAHPDDQKGPKFKNVGIANFELEIDPAVTVVPKADKSGWTLTMPVVKPAQPIRVKIFRIFKKNDAEFDLRFDRQEDGPALRTRTSYLDSDIFVVVRDFLLDVADIPLLPDALTDWNKTFDLILPLRLAKGVKPVIVPQKADSPAPKLERTGDDGRGEKWQVGPLKDALGEDAVYDVTVAFGSVGAPIVRKFKLTLAAQITITSATAEVIPGRPLELTIARGTPPYIIKLTGEPKGMTATQPSATTVILLAPGAPDEDKEVRIIVKDSSSPKLVGGRHFMVRSMPPYLLPDASPKYFDYILPPTFGLAVPLINGRSSGGAGADIDLTEPLDAMERAVAALGAGDSVYLSAWFFEPATVLTVGGIAGVATWGELFARKARDGVKIRLLINDFDSITGMDAWLKSAGLAPLDTLIAALPAGKRDNLKYLVCMHPAQVGKIKTALAGKGFKNTNVGSHHQKFMVVRKGDSLTAFCGGLDIESRKTPPTWSYAGLTGWHDIHVQLDGPITRDLEREFVERWNRDAAHSTRPARPGWAAMEVLTGTALSPVDDTPAKKLHSLQMMRTIANDGTVSLFDTKRNDIALMYERAITRAKSFIYMENQYFRSTDLADWVVGAAKKNPSLVVIMAVVASAGADDGRNLVTEHGDFLQFETFERIAKGLGPQAGFFTMTGRAVHSKFLLVDDAWMTIGSANANVRSFKLDSELNVQIGEAALAKVFRHRLWAHNLGQLEPTVAGWTTGDFLAQWRSVAAANRGLRAEDMAGEGVVPYDYKFNPGSKSILVPDALVEIDLGSEEGNQDRIA